MTSPAEVAADIACRRTLDLVAAPVRIWVPGAGVVFANRSWCELTASTLEDNAGEGWLRFVHEDDHVIVRESAPPDESRQYRVQRSDGQTVSVSDRASPWTDEATSTVIGIVHTVTPRSSDDDERGRSMSKWAHELRGPLNAILGWSDLLSAGDSAAEVVQRGLKAIANNARQQAQIIKRMTE
jgi:PAS domain S-box-containing protein